MERKANGTRDDHCDKKREKKLYGSVVNIDTHTKKRIALGGVDLGLSKFENRSHILRQRR
jgi:hypothetical protein